MGEAIMPSKGLGTTSSSSFATICVKYPENSTCTCSNGVDLYTSEGETSWVFDIPREGTWNIFVTNNGRESKTCPVAINQKGQKEYLEIIYDYVLFDGINSLGDNTNITGGWTKKLKTFTLTDTTLYGKGSASGESNKTVYYYICSTNKIDLTKYSTLMATITKENGSRNPRLGISEDGTKAIAYTEITAAGDYQLDISSYSGEYYVGLFWQFNLYGNYTMEVESTFLQLLS